MLFVPVLVIAWMGWQHRWTCDDAFINFRIVKQILAGHGPVFNTGDRVEAGTSPLWLAVLAVLDLLTPLRIEWIAALTSIAATVGGLAFAVFGTRRALLAMGVTGTFLPLGALVYAVLPPAWDFATSGLEVGLSVFWLGLCWWLLTGRIVAAGAVRRAPWQPWWIPVVIGLGPLVRPDFLIFSIFFLLALLLLAPAHTGWKPRAAALGLAAALPVAGELFRMAYFGSVVPNTAIAKEGALSSWHFGWNYLRDFIAPHWLLIPLLALGVLLVVRFVNGAPSGASGAGIVFGLTTAAAVGHGLYVVRVGGDYMHGRMFLPAFFALLLPVAVVAVRGWQWLAVAAIAIWATAGALVLRPPYSGRPAGGVVPTANDAIDPHTAISDERLVQMRLANRSHPITLEDFAKYDQWKQGIPSGVAHPLDSGFYVKQMLQAGDRGFLLAPDSEYEPASALLPLRDDIHDPIVAYVGAVGVYAYAAGNSVYIADRFGIVNPLSAHKRLTTRGRPGHEKDLPLAWAFARFASPDAPIPSGLSAQDVDAARHALSCGELLDLESSTHGSLGFGDIVDNIRHSFARARFRFDPDPRTAERELCGPQ